MARETIETDISNMPEVARLARDVAQTGKRRLLTQGGEAVAVISPVPARRPRTLRPWPKAQREAVLGAAGTWKGPIDDSEGYGKDWVPSSEGLHMALAAAEGWADLVDTEQLKAGIKRARSSRRTAVRL